ncbi:MAG: hypothetical protein ABW004_10535 [Aeromicrobium sp.]|jgi:hypothetical protein
MTATSGDWLKRAVPATMIAAALCLGACSSSDSEPSDTKTTATTAEPTVDQAAVDKAALEKLAKDIWAARQEAYNSGKASSALFEGIYTKSAIETELGRLRQYQDQKILRTGAPVITDISSTVSGDTGMIYLCLSEDDWDATEDGTVIDTPKQGASPWGASVERSADGWVLVKDQPTAAVEKEKSC